jgi:hypothetical protein
MNPQRLLEEFTAGRDHFIKSSKIKPIKGKNGAGLL